MAVARRLRHLAKLCNFGSRWIRGSASAPWACNGLAAVLLLLGAGCQTPDVPDRQAARLQETVAMLEQSVGGPKRQKNLALRRYRRAVAEVLPKPWPGADVKIGETRLLHPSPGWLGFWSRGGFPLRAEGLFRPGVGLPLVEQIKPGGANAPRGGYHVARTAMATVEPGDGREVEIEFYDPEQIDAVSLAGRKMPLAMDLEAPLDATRGLGPRPLAGLFYLLQTNRFSHPRLTFLQPYDPEKIPVVLIHGLLSTPRMWEPVVKSLLANAEIRQRYQFWFFYYPTGQPIPLSAMQLRGALDEAVRIHHVQHPLILVGHSMGGILARAQIAGITPTEADQIVPGVAELPANSLLRQALVFEPRTDVGRAIFIATPHRGSQLALHGLAGLGVRLIRLPLWIQTELSSLAETPFGVRIQRLPTSICGLSPNSSFLQTLERAPSSVAMHSIIANRGQGELESSSDGVVPYTSAHLPEAVSEKIVPAGHGGFSHPLAINEIERILLKK